jgi:hypothetical protein
MSSCGLVQPLLHIHWWNISCLAHYQSPCLINYYVIGTSGSKGIDRSFLASVLDGDELLASRSGRLSTSQEPQIPIGFEIG